jgi:acyl carrier protein
VISVADVIEELTCTAEQLDLTLDGLEITGASCFEEDLGLDSLGLMDFLAMMEDKHDVRIPDDRLADVRTVEDLADLITELRQTGDATR